MAIKFHSSVFLITNSSSETYTYVVDGADRNIKAAINAVLFAAGSNYRFDDIFEYSTERFEAYYVDQELEEEGGDDWMQESFPDGLHRPVITVKEGFELPEGLDLGMLLFNIVEAQEFGSG